jgi:hypothetical protein
MMDLLGQIIGQLFGVVIVGALILALLSRDAVDWGHLVIVYGREWRPPRMQKRFANMILYSEGRPAKSYAGVIQIGLHDDGVALRPNRLLRPFQQPIFIPYRDIQSWDQGWYLGGKSSELSFRKAPHMRLIMPRAQVEWMLAHSKGAARISDARPPHGTRPWLTYITALAFGVMTLAVIIVILVKGLPLVL